MKRILTVISMMAVAALATSCADDFDPFRFMNPDFDEGLNVHNITGTVTIPAAMTDQVGAIYVGLYSGTDDTIGFPLPVTAPGTGDAFPYGGTSIGTFEARDNQTGLRDENLICSVVNNRYFYPADDGSGDLKADFVILQFPFYPGTNAWAFADNNFTTCDPSNGYTDPGDDLESGDDDITYGTNFPDILNKPQNYVEDGDYVVESPMVLNTVDTHIEITLSCAVGVDC